MTAFSYFFLLHYLFSLNVLAQQADMRKSNLFCGISARRIRRTDLRLQIQELWFKREMYVITKYKFEHTIIKFKINLARQIHYIIFIEYFSRFLFFLTVNMQKQMKDRKLYFDKQKCLICHKFVYMNIQTNKYDSDISERISDCS